MLLLVYNVTHNMSEYADKNAFINIENYDNGNSIILTFKNDYKEEKR